MSEDPEISLEIPRSGKAEGEQRKRVWGKWSSLKGGKRTQPQLVFFPSFFPLFLTYYIFLHSIVFLYVSSPDTAQWVK